MAVYPHVRVQGGQEMSIRKLVVVAVAGGALALAACGTPQQESGPGSPESSAVGHNASTTPSSHPSAKEKPSPKPNAAPSSKTTKKASPDEKKSTSPAATASATTSPTASSDNGGQTIDPKADENAQPTKSGEQGAVLSRVPGKKTDKCVSVGSERDLRSGDFLAGPFDTARKVYGHKQPGATKRSVRLYFVPLHAKEMPGLKLTFTNSASGETVVMRQKQVADAEQWQFYDTTTVLKTPGQWTVRAKSGTDRGCFTFKLSS